MTTKLWEDWDESAAREDLAKASKPAGFSKYYPKFQAGKNEFRVLPAKPGAKSPFRVTYIHYVDLPGQKVSFVCPMQEQGMPCPICTTIARLQTSENQVDVDRAKSMTAQYTAYANVYGVYPEPAQPRAQIVKLTQKTHKTLMGFKNDFGIPFDHPIKGQNVIVSRIGTTQNDTKYTVLLTPAGPSQLADGAAAMEEVLKSMWNLDGEVVVPSFDQIQRMLRGEKVDVRKEAPRSMSAGPSRATKAITAGPPKVDEDGFMDE